MKFARTISFLLMFVFVSACNSTTPMPTSSPTNTPSPIVEATVTSTSPAPTETATKIAPTAVATALAGVEVTMPEDLRVQPNVNSAEIAAFPYCGQTFQLKIPSDPATDKILGDVMTEFQNSGVGKPVMNQVGKALSGMQVDLADPALFNLKVLPEKGDFCPFVWAVQKGVSIYGDTWMTDGALYGFFKDKSGAWVKITIKK